MIILFHGVLFTAPPGATALAIEGDRIMAVGTDEDVLNLRRAGTQQVDLGGGFVLPGLTDSHIHLDLFGQSLLIVDCGTATKEQCLARVYKRSHELPAGIWVTGHGWNQNLWDSGFGSALELDGVTADHPAFLTDMSLHSAWVNSRAMVMAGIDHHTPDPPGGIIQRDRNGNPTGILLESAVDLVEKMIPPPTSAQRQQSLLKAQEKLLSFGITAVHDFDRAPCFSSLQQMDADGSLLLRVQKSLPIEQLDEALALGLRGGFGSRNLRVGPVKMFSDGALGPQTAAMLNPYEGTTDKLGELLLSADQVLEAGIHASTAGFSLAIHAIGDRANREVLAGLKNLREYEQEHNLPSLPHRVEHMQLLDPEDLQLVTVLGICASMQPVHMYMDMHTAEKHWGKRCSNAFPINSLLSSGSRVIFGSDAPVENPNPYWGIHAAVTRKRQDAPPGQHAWYLAEQISLRQALDCYTRQPASQAGNTQYLGRLHAGYFADLVILNQNPFSIPADTLHTLLPERVMVNGNWVFAAL